MGDTHAYAMVSSYFLYIWAMSLPKMVQTSSLDIKQCVRLPTLPLRLPPSTRYMFSYGTIKISENVKSEYPNEITTDFK